MYNVLIETGAAMLMTDEHVDILKTNLGEIAQKMDSTFEILDGLVNKGIFHRNEKEEVLAERTRYRQNSTLVLRLINKEDRGFFVFVQELKTMEQHALAQLLVPGICVHFVI